MFAQGNWFLKFTFQFSEEFCKKNCFYSYIYIQLREFWQFLSQLRLLSKNQDILFSNNLSFRITLSDEFLSSRIISTIPSFWLWETSFPSRFPLMALINSYYFLGFLEMYFVWLVLYRPQSVKHTMVCVLLLFSELLLIWHWICCHWLHRIHNSVSTIFVNIREDQLYCWRLEMTW